MNEQKKFKLKLPEGIELPSGVDMPEIVVGEATLRKTILDENGNLVEVEEMIDIPIIKDEAKE